MPQYVPRKSQSQVNLQQSWKKHKLEGLQIISNILDAKKEK